MPPLPVAPVTRHNSYIIRAYISERMVTRTSCYDVAAAAAVQWIIKTNSTCARAPKRKYQHAPNTDRSQRHSIVYKRYSRHISWAHGVFISSWKCPKRDHITPARVAMFVCIRHHRHKDQQLVHVPYIRTATPFTSRCAQSTRISHLFRDPSHSPTMCVNTYNTAICLLPLSTLSAPRPSVPVVFGARCCIHTSKYTHSAQTT